MSNVHHGLCSRPLTSAQLLCFGSSIALCPPTTLASQDVGQPPGESSRTCPEMMQTKPECRWSLRDNSGLACSLRPPLHHSTTPSLHHSTLITHASRLFALPLAPSIFPSSPPPACLTSTRTRYVHVWRRRQVGASHGCLPAQSRTRARTRASARARARARSHSGPG